VISNATVMEKREVDKQCCTFTMRRKYFIIIKLEFPPLTYHTLSRWSHNLLLSRAAVNMKVTDVNESKVSWKLEVDDLHDLLRKMALEKHQDNATIDRMADNIEELTKQYEQLLRDYEQLKKVCIGFF